MGSQGESIRASPGKEQGRVACIALWAKALTCRSVGAGEAHSAGEADELQLPPGNAKGRLHEAQPGHPGACLWNTVS